MKIFKITLILLLIAFVAQAQEEFKLDQEYRMNLSGTIYLDSDDADVTISGSDRPDVRVRIYRKVETKGFVWGDTDFEVIVEENDGDLKIYEKSSGSHISVVGYMEEKYTIDIEAPKGVSLTINGDDDDYLITNINGAIDLDIDDGDAELRNCGGSYFKFDLDDGDINVDQARGKLIARLDDGDIEIENATFDEVDVRVDDGDIVIETSFAANGSYKFRADDSDIVLNITGGDADIEIDHDDSRLYTSGDFQTLQDGEDFTRLKLGTGGAAVRIDVDDATVRLTAR
ncbi:MAG: DUF4097 family beta strand repeat-containing protein [Fulvivirga sp.]